MKFRKKPVVIDALQFDGSGDVARNIVLWSQGKVAADANEILWVFTLEGQMKAQKNDWIIKGVKGEFYPCKPDIFEMTYEPMEAEGNTEERT